VPTGAQNADPSDTRRRTRACLPAKIHSSPLATILLPTRADAGLLPGPHWTQDTAFILPGPWLLSVRRTTASCLLGASSSALYSCALCRGQHARPHAPVLQPPLSFARHAQVCQNASALVSSELASALSWLAYGTDSKLPNADASFFQASSH